MCTYNAAHPASVICCVLQQWLRSNNDVFPLVPSGTDATFRYSIWYFLPINSLHLSGTLCKAFMAHRYPYCRCTRVGCSLCSTGYSSSGYDCRWLRGRFRFPLSSGLQLKERRSGHGDREFIASRIPRNPVAVCCCCVLVCWVGFSGLLLCVYEYLSQRRCRCLTLPLFSHDNSSGIHHAATFVYGPPTARQVRG